MFGYGDMMMELNIPLSHKQLFVNVLYNYLGFKPKHRNGSNKVDLDNEERLFIANSICNEDKLIELSKSLSRSKSLLKYGVDSPNKYLPKRKQCSKTIKVRGNNREKYKRTCLAKYGGESANTNADKIEKAKQTCLQKYGCTSSAGAGTIIRQIQTANSIRTKLAKYGYIPCKSMFEYNGIHFESKLEFYFYIYHTEVLGEVVKRGPNLTYMCDNKEKIYSCDFQIEDKLYEIKGSWLVNDKGELYCPFTKGKTSEEIESSNRIYLSKYKCMLKNNVIMLTERDLVVEKEYGEKRYKELFQL